MKTPTWLKPALISFALAVVLTLAVTFLYVNPEVLRVDRAGVSQADSISLALVKQVEGLRFSVDSLRRDNLRLWANEAARRAASDAKLAEANRSAATARAALTEALAAFELSQALSVPEYVAPPNPFD